MQSELEHREGKTVVNTDYETESSTFAIVTYFAWGLSPTLCVTFTVKRVAQLRLHAWYSGTYTNVQTLVPNSSFFPKYRQMIIVQQTGTPASTSTFAAAIQFYTGHSV